MPDRSWRSLAALLLAALPVLAQQPQAEPEKLTLKYQDTPIRDVAKDLSTQLGTVILVDDEVEGNLTFGGEIRKDQALRAMADRVQAVPVRAAIFCSEEEVKGEAALRRQAKVTLDFAAEARLKDVAAEIAKQSRLRVRCTEATADLKLTYTNAEQDVAEAMQSVAAAAKCKWVEGWLIFKVDPSELLDGLDRFSQLPEDQRTAMIAGGFDQFLNDYRNQSPEERKETIKQLVGQINNMAAAVNRADPAARARIKAGLAPVLKVAVSKFVGLNAREQSEFGPAVNALKQLQ